MLVALAMAMGSVQAAEPVAEEVIVWGDPFARWDDTRWHVMADLALQDDMVLALSQQARVRARQFSLEATIHCRKDIKLGPKSYEVRCKVETVSVQIGLPSSDRERWADKVQELLVELDERLTGATLELQVGARGTVPNIGLEGVEARNRDQRRTRELARELFSRLVAPFHLAWPDDFGPQLGIRWEETRSSLFELPSGVGTVSSSAIAHYLNSLDGKWIVQSIGRGTSSTLKRNPYVGLPCDYVKHLPEVYHCAKGSVEVPEYSQAELVYDLSYDGVGVVDPETGYLTERVWSVTGVPTASAIGSSSPRRYAYHGRLRKLD